MKKIFKKALLMGVVAICFAAFSGYAQELDDSRNRDILICEAFEEVYNEEFPEGPELDAIDKKYVQLVLIPVVPKLIKKTIEVVKRGEDIEIYFDEVIGSLPSNIADPLIENEAELREHFEKRE